MNKVKQLENKSAVCVVLGTLLLLCSNMSVVYAIIGCVVFCIGWDYSDKADHEKLRQDDVMNDYDSHD